jgi:hypothetical protein
VAGLLAAAPLAALAAPARPAAPPKAARPAAPAKSVYGGPRADWTGVWVVPGSFLDLQDGTSVSAPSGRSDPGIDVIFSLGRPKLKPAPAKAAAEAQAAEAAGRPIADPRTACVPSGVAGFWGGPYAWEIVQAHDQINLGQEYLRQVRRIYLDGRKHPSLDDADPLLLGHSIGHWEGDVLVVDTANFSPTGRVSGALTNPDEQTRVVERFRPVGPDRIDVEVTITSPNALEEPWRFVRKLKRKPGLEILDYFCEENERNPVAADGLTQSILPPQPK